MSTTTDVAARNRLYRQVADVAAEQSPYLLLPADLNVRPLRASLQGVNAATYNPLRNFNFTGTFIRELSKK